VEHVTEGLHPPLPDMDQEPTFHCPDCTDTGYTETQPATIVVTVEGRDRRVSAGGALVAWFCDCARGRAAHAGYWFDLVFPMQGNARGKSDRGERRLGEYLSARPLERTWLPDAVEHLRQRHEALRKRKLAEAVS
jgi:hypothetical protein